jgi:hypothetical protein
MPKRPTVDPDTKPCPDCGQALPDLHSARRGQSKDNGPLWKPTPLARIWAVAEQAGMRIVDIPKNSTDGLGGAIACALDENEELRGIIFLAEDLDDNTRADILAFGMSVFVGETHRITNTPEGRIGIGRKRLQSAKKGAGHLAWHLLQTCGRTTPSATFSLVHI